MRTHVQVNINKFNVVKLGLILVVLMYFALSGFPQKNTRPILRLSGTYTQGAYTDETVLFFDPIASTDFNPKTDAHKLMNTEPTIPNIYSVKNDQKLAINGLPEITDGLVIPIGYDVTLPGTYTISANQIVNFDTLTTKVYLEDLAMNVTQDLMSNPNYMFVINPSDKGSRFFVRFKLTQTGVPQVSKNNVSKVFAVGNSLYINHNARENADVTVFDIQGRSIFEVKSLNTGLHTYNLNTTPGCYMVRVVSKESVDMQKVYIY